MKKIIKLSPRIMNRIGGKFICSPLVTQIARVWPDPSSGGQRPGYQLTQSVLEHEVGSEQNHKSWLPIGTGLQLLDVQHSHLQS